MCPKMYPEQSRGGSRPACEPLLENDRESSPAERQVTDILALAARELSTPVSIVAGYAEVLAQETGGALGPRQRMILNNLLDSIGRLKQLVQDCLAWRATPGGPAVRLQDGDLSTCLEEICNYWQKRYRENGVALNYRVNGPFRTFPFDFLHVQHVISNLLDSALRFSPQGATVQVNQEAIFWERRSRSLPAGEERRNQQNRSSNAVRVVVTDAGEVAGREMEGQPEAVRSEPEAGESGLSWAVARRVVEAHGGRIWVESVDGKPTCFCLVLPFATAGAQPQAETQA